MSEKVGGHVHPVPHPIAPMRTSCTHFVRSSRHV